MTSPSKHDEQKNVVSFVWCLSNSGDSIRKVRLTCLMSSDNENSVKAVTPKDETAVQKGRGEQVSAWPETIVITIFCAPMYSVVAAFADLSFCHRFPAGYFALFPILSCLLLTTLASTIRWQPTRTIILSICLTTCNVVLSPFVASYVTAAVGLASLLIGFASVTELVFSMFFDKKAPVPPAIGCVKASLSALLINVFYCLVVSGSTFVSGFHVAAMLFVCHMLVWNRADNIRYIGDKVQAKKRRKPWFLRLLRP